MSTLAQIHQGLALAKAKGCPVESIWVSKATHEEIKAGTSSGHYGNISGHHVSVVTMELPWEIKLACGWTDQFGDQRRVINTFDLCEAEHVTPSPIDTTEMEQHPLWATF